MQLDIPIVYKYFDLIDEFIKVRILADHPMPEFIKPSEISNKRQYRRKIINTCIVELEEAILSQITESMPEDVAIAEDLLYQICIDVNPRLEIHQVAIPAEHDQQPMATPLLDDHDAVTKEKRFLRKAASLEQELRRSIVGQDEAIATIGRAIRKSATGIAEPHRPIGCLMLVGKTGTGKTVLAKAVAKHLYEKPECLIRIDCSEFALPHEYAKLIGAPPGYVGHGDGGMLTEAIRKNPQAVVLFDEIEKAHWKLHNLLLQVLDEGYLTDSKGRTVSFEKALILLTSNIGVDVIQKSVGRMGFDLAKRNLEHTEQRNLTVEALQKHFSPEFLNRLDDIVVFNNLSAKDCRGIAELVLADVANRTRKTGIRVMFNAGVAQYVANNGYSEEYGAREIRRIVKKEIEDVLAAMILDNTLRRGSRVRVGLRNKALSFTVQKNRKKS